MEKKNLKCSHCGGEAILDKYYNGKPYVKCKVCGKYGYSSDEQPVNTIGISLDEFRKKNDVKYIITTVLKGLSPDMMYEKADIYRIAGLRPGFPGVQTILESKEVADYTGKVNSSVWFGHPKTIKELKNQGILL